MRNLILIIILLISTFLVKAGSITITGNICNSKTGDPISYACIALVEVQKGTTSLENGDFVFIIDSNDIKNTLFISCLNYSYLKIPIRDFLNNPSKKLFLDPLSYKLSEVTIQPKDDIELIFNKLKKSKIDGSSLNTGIPCICVRYFEQNEDVNNIVSVQIYCQPNIKKNRSKVRLRFYGKDSVTNSPSIDLINKEIIVELKSNKINNIDLKEYGIQIPKGGIFVGFEYLIIPENKFIETQGYTNGEKKQYTCYGPILGFNYTVVSNTYEYWAGKWMNYNTQSFKIPQFKEKLTFDAAISITVTN